VAVSVGVALPKAAIAAGGFAPLALALAPALLLVEPAAVRGAETRRAAMLASHRVPTCEFDDVNRSLVTKRVKTDHRIRSYPLFTFTLETSPSM
jgi:hypothetical protein